MLKDVQKLEERHEIIKILNNLEVKFGKTVGSFGMGVNDTVQEGRTNTLFKCVRSCYKKLGSNLFFVLFMDRARYRGILGLRIYSTEIDLHGQLVAAPQFSSLITDSMNIYQE